MGNFLETPFIPKLDVRERFCEALPPVLPPGQPYIAGALAHAEHHPVPLSSRNIM
jgi:hypothetical protein